MTTSIEEKLDKRNCINPMITLYGALFAKCTTFLHYLSEFVNTLYFSPLGKLRMLKKIFRVPGCLDI